MPAILSRDTNNVTQSEVTALHFCLLLYLRTSKISLLLESKTFQDRFQVGMTPLVSMEKTQQLPGAVLLFLFSSRVEFMHFASPERL